MEQKKARFLFMDNPDSLIITDWAVISNSPNPFIKSKKELNDRAKQLFLYKLYHFNGLVPPFDDTPSRLRLIFEEGEIKIFELVQSATIKGTKNSVLKAKIATPSRTFFYISQGRASKEGKEFVMPYTIDSPYPVKATEIYLEQDGKKMPLNITENMVQGYQ